MSSQLILWDHEVQAVFQGLISHMITDSRKARGASALLSRLVRCKAPQLAGIVISLLLICKTCLFGQPGRILRIVLAHCLAEGIRVENRECDILSMGREWAKGNASNK